MSATPRWILDRRAFLRDATTTALAAAAWPQSILERVTRPAAAIRIRGRVRAAGRGVARARVTDGSATVATDADGRFEIVSDTARQWLSLSLPSGYDIPVSDTGTALLHRPIPRHGGEVSVAFDLDRLPVGDDRHAFLLLADPQTETMWEMNRLHGETVPDVRATLAGIGLPSFGVACGDIMYDDLSLFPEYERAVKRMEAPFFQVVGNHDLDPDAPTDPASTLTFQHHFGPARYSFDRGAVHYVVLDDVFWHGAGYIGYLDEDTLEWLAGDLAHLESGRTVIVMLHIPVLGSQDVRTGRPGPDLSLSVANRDALHRLLEPFRAHVLSGHTHEAEHTRHGGVREHVNGAVCGAWWSGDICHDGTPNGYGVYEVSGEELTWRYKATGRPADHQLRAYPPGADPAAPDELVANVWFADEDWSVVWYENGERRGAMARRVGLDPMAVALHAGVERPAHRPWVEPMPTAHLYYAPVPRGADVLVEATDPFGGVFTARPEPVAAPPA